MIHARAGTANIRHRADIAPAFRTPGKWYILRSTYAINGDTFMEITRRSVLAGAAVATGVTRAAAAEWAPNPHYPDPTVKVLDPSFLKYRPTIVGVERLATGMTWSEGPVWFGDGRYLIWSDIPNNRLMRWDEATGAVGVFREPSNQANGNTRDRQGRLISCEHRTRRVTRTEYDGEITVLADRFEGKRLNSPNDVVVKSDDSIWFTDPPYGIVNNYNGSVENQELPMNVYRLDKTGRIAVVADGIKLPDGLAFSPDEKTLYVIEDGSTPPAIRAYDVIGDGTRLANGRVFISIEKGRGDGLRLDVDGNLWCGWAGGEGLDGVMIFNNAGAPIGRIDLPERCANVCFGGYRRSRLFMAASRSLYSVWVGTSGAPGG
jgi:gluconolactonase